METFGSMETGEWLTRGTVWLALSLYAGAEMAKAGGRGEASTRLSRWLNTVGCAAFFCHVACAFGFYHHWSHAAAYADTARQTRDLTGWEWGGGLYVNYLFAMVWAVEIVWSWVAPGGYLKRPKWITGAVGGVFLFMIFNGAVVFVHGLMRWFGLMACLILVSGWIRTKMAGRTGSS